MNSKVRAKTRNDSELTIGQCATIACLLEVTAPKPGNVHRGADFDDVTFADFAISAAAIGPVLDRTGDQALGDTVLQCVEATRRLVGKNTNLGLILLLSPLATAAECGSLDPDGVERVLNATDATDCQNVYRAIRVARPGGLGRADRYDVADSPPEDLMVAMRSAAERDLVARQYVTGFRDVFSEAVPEIMGGLAQDWSLVDAIIHAQLQLMSRFPDSLIARKCGPDEALRASALAQGVIDAGRPGQADYFKALHDFDFWLRSDGHRRNPGTTADIIGAGLFVGLWNQQIQLAEGDLLSCERDRKSPKAD